MIKSASIEPRAELSLEKARLDLFNTRTQMAVGLILVAGLSLINFASHFATCSAPQEPAWFVTLTKQSNLIDWILSVQCPAVATITLWLDWFFCHTTLDGYLMTSFVITLACSILAALVCLELTGRYGNRLRAVPAIWSAVLFNLYPPVLHCTCDPSAAREYQLNCLFLLMTTFALCRWFLLKEKLYIVTAVAGFILLSANGLVFEFALPQPGLLAKLPEELRLLLFPEHNSTRNLGIIAFALPLAYFLIAGVFGFRMLRARERLRPIALCLVGLIIAICLFKPGEDQSRFSHNLFYAAAPFSLSLSLLAFPIGAQLKLSHNKVAALIGLSALLILAFSWAK